MKTFTRDILISFLLGVIVPAMILGILIGLDEAKRPSPEETVLSAGTGTVPMLQKQFPIPVLAQDGTVVDMDLETYLCGVVLSEMPADFEIEALKAQAVVARTYAMRRLTAGTKHALGAVCMEPACCQGYITEKAFIEKGGDSSQIAKITRSVLLTSGEVLEYDGELIDATYFSCSGGRTEDAVAVWGNDVPYLQSTDSPGEEEALHYTDTVVFLPSEIEAALDVVLEGPPEDWFKVLSTTEGNSVEKIDICGSVFTGVEVRKALSLRSTAFTVTANEDQISIVTYGYGHRVGMSQYGADAMAAEGFTYDQILAHYYKGTSLVEYQPDD